MKSNLTIIHFLFLPLASVLADFVVSPNLGRDPDAYGTSPLLVASDLAPSVRLQQVHAASDFDYFDMLPLLITEISFRPHPAGLTIDASLQNIQIDFSTTLREPDGLSVSFSENLGADNTTVFSGPLHFVDTGLEVYGLNIQLQQPFVYDVGAGNLLVDIRNFAPLAPPPSGKYLVALEITFGDTVSHVSSENANALIGLDGTAGFTTRFTVTPIPEPSMAVLFLAWTVAFAIFGRIRIGPGVLRGTEQNRTKN